MAAQQIQKFSLFQVPFLISMAEQWKTQSIFTTVNSRSRDCVIQSIAILGLMTNEREFKYLSERCNSRGAGQLGDEILEYLRLRYKTNVYGLRSFFLNNMEAVLSDPDLNNNNATILNNNSATILLLRRSTGEGHAVIVFRDNNNILNIYDPQARGYYNDMSYLTGYVDFQLIYKIEGEESMEIEGNPSDVFKGRTRLTKSRKNCKKRTTRSKQCKKSLRKRSYKPNCKKKY